MQSSAQRDATLFASSIEMSINRDGKAGLQRTVAIVQTQAENAGAQEVARQLARGFETRGWRVRQIFSVLPTESFDGDHNVFFCARGRPHTPLGVLKMLAELFKEFRRERPEAVITLQHYGNVIAAPVARLSGARQVIANQLSASELIPAFVRIADKIMGSTGLFDHIVVNSAQTEADYRSYPESYAKRITRIDHGFFDKSTTISKADARRKLGFPQDIELLGCAARLHPLKQIDFAIRALAFDEAQHLALAGQGEDRGRLSEIAEALGVASRVHFLGELNTAQMGEFLAAIDCFVFPSATETFGLAAVEAAQAGAPVVANDIEILRDVLSVGGEPCALFVDARDARALASAVRSALDDDTLRQELTSRGRRLADRYPLEAMIDEYARLMEPQTK